MSFFRKLPIFHKIITILAIAILSFVVNLVININSITKNQLLLKDIQHTTIHLVNLTSENVNMWQHIDEIYSQSVSFGDEDLIEQANELVEKLSANLKRIDLLDQTFANIDDLKKQSQEYNTITKKISMGFINEEIDFQSASTQSDIKK